MSPLFRKEAAESRGQKFANPIKVDGVPTTNVALGFFAVLFIGLTIFGLNVPYQNKINVSGFLDGATTLDAETSGLLNILVPNGAEVIKGEQIAILRSEQTDKTGVSNQDKEIESLKRQLNLIQSGTEEMNIAKANLENLTTLRTKKLVTNASLNEAKLAVLTAQRNVLDSEREKETIEEKIRQIRSAREIAITAPVSGTLTYLQAKQHERVTHGQPLFKIRENDSDLVGVLLSPTRATGLLRKGDTVHIRYAAFAYQKYGVFDGKVTSIDQAAQKPDELDAPIAMTEPVYRVFVELDQKPVSKGGEPLRLSQDMIFEASVVIDAHPVIWWLLSPGV